MEINPTSTGKREPIVVAVILALVSACLILPSIHGHDGVGNYVYLMSMLNDGDLNFANEYAAFDLKGGESVRFSAEPVSPATGRPANRYGIGSALFWSPAVVIVHALLKIVAPDEATGISRPYEWAVGAASAWWGGLGIWLLYMRLRERFNWRVSATAMAGILFATPLCFYVWAHGSMSHGVSFFISVMSLLVFERGIIQPNLRNAALLGVWLGLFVITRFQDATWALTLGGMICFVGARSEKAGDPTGRPYRLTSLACMILCLAVVALPQLAVWKILYGNWLSGPSPYFNRGAGSLNVLPLHIWGALFSGRHGALAWHPILIAGLLGMIMIVRTAAPEKSERSLIFVGLIGLAVQVYLVASWSMWWGGASFGNRFFISSYPYLAMGLAYGLELLERQGWRRIGPMVVMALIVWNAGLLVQYGTQMISREDEVGWTEIIANQFTQVPEWVIQKLIH